MLSVTGRLRGCAWSGGSPWGSPPGQDRRSFSRFQSLSYRQTFPVAVFSWQKLAPGVVFPYGSWLCWKKLRSGNCGKARWVRSVIRLSLRGPSAGAHSVQEGKTVLLLGPPHDTGKAAAAFRSCPRKVPESLDAETVPCPCAPAARSFAAVADSAGGLRRSRISGRRREAFSRFAVVFRKGRADRSPAAAFPPGTPVQAAWLLRKIPLDKLFILCILGIYNMNGGVTWRS